jgi:hypothetical protein
MKKLLLPMMVCVSAFLGIVPVSAQDNRLECNVPFDFNIGPTTMTAGHYMVTFPSNGVVQIRNLDSNKAAATITIPAIQPHQRLSDRSRLVFTRYPGDQYFLAEVWKQGREYGNVLRKSQSEIKVASGRSEQIIVASR